MRTALNHIKTKLEQRFLKPDFLASQKDAAAIHGIRDLARFCKFFWRNRKYILEHRDELRQESKDYMRVLDDPELLNRPTLENSGFVKTGNIIRNLDDGKHYEVLIGESGGIEVYALEDIAKRMFLYKSFTDRTYENLCRMYAKSDSDVVDCRIGTERLWEAMRDRAGKEYERAHLNLHFSEDKEEKPIKDDKIHLSIPPSTCWDHAQNELVTDPIYRELPHLSDEWEELRIRLNAATDIHQIEWVGVRSQRLPKSIEPESHGRISHATYGEFGYKNDCVKNGFKGWMKRTEKNGLLRGTGSVSIGPHIPAALPRFNRNDSATILFGMAGRIGREPIPLSDLYKIQRQYPYVTHDRNLIHDYFVHAVDFIISELEEKGLHPQMITPEDSWRWLASTHFPRSKKQAYLESFKRVIHGDVFIPAEKFDNTHKAFPKNESYLSGDKPQRMILAGSYEMASVLAPACAILGNYFFSLCYTSKKIPEYNRPAVALNYFRDSRVILNDMSAFEGSIDGWVKELCENRILNHFFPNIKPWVDRTLEPLRIFCKDAGCMAPTMRCSGDPQTSLGNSLTNLASIIAAYCYSEGRLLDFGEIKRNLTAWVEGDDSLVSWFPTWGDDEAKFDLYRNAFIMMGFATKMEKKDFVGDAGYCSMFFNTDCELCPRVAQTFLDFPWDHNNQYNRGLELLYLKASSLHHVCPGQPLTWALARYYSPPVSVIARLPWNSYEYEEFIREGYEVQINGNFMDIIIPSQVFGVQPSDSSRQLFADKYGIDSDDQRDIEDMILKYGPVGLIKAKHSLRRNWTYLQQLCRVDGINFADCRHFYESHYEEIRDQDLEIVSMSITSGIEQKPDIRVRKIPHVIDSVGLPHGHRSGTIIDPYTYHVNKAQKAFMNRSNAKRTHRYQENRCIYFWSDYKHLLRSYRNKLLFALIAVSVLLILPTLLITIVSLFPVILKTYLRGLQFVKWWLKW